MTQWTKRFSLEGRRALVTGASKGIGFETCRVLADAGADIAAVGRDEAGLAEVCEAVEALGRRCVPITADLATVEGPRAAARAALEAFGTIDILVNNAGVMDLFQSVADVSNDTWRRVLSVNLDGPMFAMRRAVPLMLAQGSGSIVNVSSVAGVGGGSAGAAYTSSKHALNGLTKSTAFQHAKQGLRCNAIASGGVTTNIMQSVDATKLDQAALGRIGPYHAANPGMLEPVDIANLVLFLASDESRYINGAIIPADMGWRAA